LNHQSSYLETYFTGCISFLVAPSFYAISMSKLRNKTQLLMRIKINKNRSLRLRSYVFLYLPSRFQNKQKVLPMFLCFQTLIHDKFYNEELQQAISNHRPAEQPLPYISHPVISVSSNFSLCFQILSGK